jgi:hypothetical protein
MLKSLDVLIGLTVIMLVLSMGVTMITQCVTTMVNSRGRHLRRGLIDLLGLLDPALAQKAGEAGRSIAGRIADAVLTHPLISSSGGRLGSVVHREELTRLLLDLAGDSTVLEPDAKAVLQQALVRNGVSDPTGTLRKVRDASLALEMTHPRLAADVRQTMAVLQEARSEFTAKIHGAFDQTIDRVAQRFTASTHAITFVAALLVAVGLQVDVIGLVNRLSADDMLRQAFVTYAASVRTATPAGVAPQAATPDAVGGGAPATPAMELQYMAFLADHGLIGSPRTWRQWVERWGELSSPGVLLTSLLLSLGAPFWYSALGRLLQLRSALAVKDDDQRRARQKPTEANEGGGP